MAAAVAVAVVYCYNESKPIYKENLQFFLRNCYRPDDGITYVFVVNGTLTVGLPKTAKVIMRENTGWDFAAYGVGIRWLLAKEIPFNHVFFVNCSARGAFIPPYLGDSVAWYDPFLSVFTCFPEILAVSPTVFVRDGVKSVHSYMFVLTRDAILKLDAVGFWNRLHRDRYDMIQYQYHDMCKILEGRVKSMVAEDLKSDMALAEGTDISFPYRCFCRTIHPYEAIFIKTTHMLAESELASLSKIYMLP